MNKKRPTFKQFKKDALQDKEVKAEYDLLETEFSLIEKTIKLTKHEDCLEVIGSCRKIFFASKKENKKCLLLRRAFMEDLEMVIVLGYSFDLTFLEEPFTSTSSV